MKRKKLQKKKVRKIRKKQENEGKVMEYKGIKRKTKDILGKIRKIIANKRYSIQFKLLALKERQKKTTT